MPSRLRRRRQTRMARVKVDRRRAIAHLAVQRANVRDAMQRNAHGNLQLDGRDVHARHHLRCGMLDLQARIQLQERKLVRVRCIQPLDGAGRHVPHQLGKAHGGLLHALPRLRRRDRDGRLLNDLLVAALHGAVSAKQADDLAVLISQQLHLEMARCFGEFHHKDR